MTAPLIIIGTGLAGYSVAREWRKLDPDTPLVIFCADSGDFYSKPLLSTALTHQKAPDDLAMASFKEMGKTLNAQIFTFTEVTNIDPTAKTVMADGKSHAYSQLVLATGASPIHLEMLQAVGASSVNSLDAYRTFRRKLQPNQHVVIVGAGLVGSEFAHDLSTSGHKVTVIAKESAPLNTFIPEQFGKQLQEKMEDMKVTYHLNATLQAAEKVEEQTKLTLDNGVTVLGDTVLSAVGIRAKLDLANAAGLAVSRGIIVDDCLQTSDECIFALGDAIEQQGEVRQYIAPIMHQARALAKTLAGDRTVVVYPAMPVVVKTPSFPITFVRPNEFDVEEVTENKTLYFKNGKLVGFLLVGDANKERAMIMAQLV